jgi:hypothetical protein
MRTVTMQVGYNLRAWLSVEIADATDEEIDILLADTDDSIFLAAELDEAGRLTIVGEEHDDNPEIYSPVVDASILDVTITEGDSDV